MKRTIIKLIDGIKFKVCRGANGCQKLLNLTVHFDKKAYISSRDGDTLFETNCKSCRRRMSHKYRQDKAKGRKVKRADEGRAISLVTESLWKPTGKPIVTGMFGGG